MIITLVLHRKKEKALVISALKPLETLVGQKGPTRAKNNWTIF